MTTEVTQNTTQTEQAATDAPVAHSINIADLQNVVRVIDHACEQGAFKGWAVIEQVFALRAKIDTFVKASLPPEEEKPKKAASAKKPAKPTTTAPAAKAKAPAAKAPAKAPAAPAKPAAKSTSKVPAKKVVPTKNA